MEQINNSVRCCATCTFWLGHRVPNRLGYVDVFSKMDSAKCGAHIATVPYKVFHQMLKHPLTDSGIEKFLADWKSVPNAN